MCVCGVLLDVPCVCMYVCCYTCVSECVVVCLLCVCGLLLDLLMLCFTDSEPEPPEETPPACKTEHRVIPPYYHTPPTNTSAVVYVKRLGTVLYVLSIKFALIL